MNRLLKNIICLCAMMMSGIKLFATAPCVISQSRCSPIYGPEYETMCVSFFNGTGVSWFQAKNECEADGGRLAHIGNYSTESGLLTTAHTQRAMHVRVGVLASIRVDEMTFVSNTNVSKDMQCANMMTQKCSSTTLQSECAALGCCFHNNICQYPENQFVASIDLNATRYVGSSGTERSCVQLNHNDSWSPFNCSEPGGVNTVYACERKCSANWPAETYETVTWLAPSAMSPLLSESTTTGRASYSTLGATSTAMSPLVSESTTTGRALHSTSAPNISTIKHTTIDTVKETSSEGNQNVACQFNVQVLWLTFLMAMSMVCL